MVGIFIGKALFRMESVDSDSQRSFASGVGIADCSAIPARDSHNGFVGIELPEDVAVDVRSTEGVPQHSLSINRPFHSVPGC